MKAPPPPAKDPLALGLGSLGAGVAFGGACLTAAQIVASILRGEVEPSGSRATAAQPLTAGHRPPQPRASRGPSIPPAVSRLLLVSLWPPSPPARGRTSSQ